MNLVLKFEYLLLLCFLLRSSFEIWGTFKVSKEIILVPQAAPAPPATPKPNKFFVFQPFNQKPASKPFRTPVNPDAFVIKPQSAPARPPQSPPTLISQGGRPISSPQAVPAPPRPAPVAPQRPQAPRAQSAPIPQSQLPPGVFAVPAGQPIPAGAIRVNPQGQAINIQGQLIPEPARATHSSWSHPCQPPGPGHQHPGPVDP